MLTVWWRRKMLAVFSGYRTFFNITDSIYSTIIPRARMGSESIAHEAEGRMAIDSEAMRARGIIVLVKSN